jgi:hypothetical protein
VTQRRKKRKGRRQILNKRKSQGMTRKRRENKANGIIDEQF